MMKTKTLLLVLVVAFAAVAAASTSMTTTTPSSVAEKSNNDAFLANSADLSSTGIERMLNTCPDYPVLALKFRESAIDVAGIGFAGDENLCMASLAGGGFIMYHLYSGTLIREYEAWFSARSTAFTKLRDSDSYVIIGLGDGRLVIFDQQFINVVGESGDHPVTALAIYVDDSISRTVSASQGIVTVWDIAGLTPLHSFQAHDEEISAIVITSDGSTMITASADSTLAVWELETGNSIGTLTGHTAGVTSITLSVDESQIVSSSEDSTVRIWGFESLELDEILNHSAPVVAVDVTPNEEYIISATAGSIFKWSTEDYDLTSTFSAFTEDIVSILVRSDSTTILVGDSTGLRTLELDGGFMIVKFDAHAEFVYSTLFTEDGESIVSGSGDKRIKFWSTATGEQTASFDVSSPAITTLDVSSNKEYVAFNNENNVEVLDVESGTIVATFESHTDLVNSVVFTSDGTQIASGGADNKVFLWEFSTSGSDIDDIDSTSLQYEFDDHTGSVTSVDISPDGTLLVSGSTDSNVILYDLSDGSLKSTLTGHSDEVNVVTFSFDSSQIASASADSTIRVWDVDSGVLIQSLTGHTENVIDLTFSPNNNIILSAGETEIFIWDVSTGESVDSHHEQLSEIGSLSISADGQQVVASGADGFIVWTACWSCNSVDEDDQEGETYQCSSNCDEGTFFDPSKMECEPDCPLGLYGDTLHDLCVFECSEDYFIHESNSTCLVSCPDGYSENTDTMTCDEIPAEETDEDDVDDNDDADDENVDENNSSNDDDDDDDGIHPGVIVIVVLLVVTVIVGGVVFIRRRRQKGGSQRSRVPTTDNTQSLPGDRQ